jgi:hypothetical protein
MPESNMSTRSGVSAADRDEPTQVAASMAPQAEAIKVYVRLGDNESERTISFRIPENVDPLDLLERGATIDGNQAMISAGYDAVASENEELGRRIPVYSCPDLSAPDNEDYKATSLVRVLGHCQRSLVRYLKSLGYQVEFA